MYALKSDECKEMEAKLHQEQMESIFQRDMLQYLIHDKVDVAVDHGIIWQGWSLLHLVCIPSLCTSVPYLLLSRNGKTIETSNLVET